MLACYDMLYITWRSCSRSTDWYYHMIPGRVLGHRVVGHGEQVSGGHLPVFLQGKGLHVHVYVFN